MQSAASAAWSDSNKFCFKDVAQLVDETVCSLDSPGSFCFCFCLLACLSTQQQVTFEHYVTSDFAPLLLLLSLFFSGDV